MAPALVKSLSRLSRDSLIDLCLDWSKSSKANPYLVSNRNLHESEEEDYLHEPADSRKHLKELYQSIKYENQDTSLDELSKREIIDRIVDGDWRRGLSYHQLATIDFAYLEQNDTAMRWSALKLVPLQQSQKDESTSHPAKRRKIATKIDELHYPEISPTSFVEQLKSIVSPMVKANYHMHRLKSQNGLAIVRLFIMPNTPFAPRNINVPKNSKTATEASRTMYIALPRACPYVYVSVSGSAINSKTKDGSTQDSSMIDIATIKRIVLEAIPKALSKPQQRWSLEATKLSTKSLRSIAILKGNERPGTAGGAYSQFNALQSINTKSTKRLEKVPSTTEGDDSTNSRIETIPTMAQTLSRMHLQDISTEREKLIEKRFGLMTPSTTDSSNRAHIDAFHVQIRNLRPVSSRSTTSKPTVTPRSKRKRKRMTDIEAEQDNANDEQDNIVEPIPITIHFSGSDIFRGLKQLALLGPEFVDLNHLPAWMTGEKGVSSLTV